MSKDSVKGQYRQLDITLPEEARALSGRDFLCLPQEFFQSAAHTAVQTPLNSLNQMVDHRYLPEIQIIEAPAPAAELSPRWHAQQLGAALGAATDIAAIEIVSRGSVPPVMVGAIYDGLVRPVSPDVDCKAPGEQLKARLQNAAIGGLGYATFHATNRALGAAGKELGEKFSSSLAPTHTCWKQLATNNSVRNIASGTLAGIPAGLLTTTLSGGRGAHDLAIGAYTSTIGGLGLGAINAHLERQSAAREKNISFQRLQREAVTDHLTGLHNRRGIDASLANEFERSSRTDKPLSLIYGDLDGFKNINDVFGHGRGDQALSIVSKLIKENIRAYDHAGRTGGDEFTIVLPETDARTARQLAARLQEAINLKFAGDDGREHTVGISLGVVTRQPQDVTAEVFHKRADAEMYRVKHARKAAN